MNFNNKISNAWISWDANLLGGSTCENQCCLDKSQTEYEATGWYKTKTKAKTPKPKPQSQPMQS